MTAFHLKLLAIITMIIDHVGLFFFPELYWMRIVGRISFPLFAFLIANGAIHTKNSLQYLFRLIIFALLSQIPYDLAHRAVIPDFTGLNIFFTLSIGLAAIIITKQVKNTFLFLFITSIFGLVAEFMDAGYGIYGIFIIALFYRYFDHFRFSFIAQSLTAFIFNTIPVLLADRIMLRTSINQINTIQPFALVSLFFIGLYNGKEGPKMRYLFYLFYPLHFLLIYWMLK